MQGGIPFDIRFAIFIACKQFNHAGYDLDDTHPSMDTLHMYGLADTVIPPDISKILSESYPNKTVFVHDGAHIIPSTSAAKIALKELLKKFL